MTTDYAPYLRVTEDGHIWWLLRDAYRLGAGYLPLRDDQRMLTTELRAPNDRALLNERTLVGAFQDKRLSLEQPMTFERDGFRYVEAEGFLTWLSQYIALTQATEIAFPNELASEVKKARAKAAASQPPATSQEFDSLSLALDGWFDKNLNDLPRELHQRAEREFSPIPWDELSADQRRDYALQQDYLHDPATEQDREYWWNFFTRLRELKAQLQQWQTAATPTASDIALQETRIKELQQEIDRMELQERLTQGDYYPGRKRLDAEGEPTPATSFIADSTLPSDVLSLIRRKLRHLRSEHDKKWPDITRSAYSKMNAAIIENLRAGRQEQATIAVPISAYREIVAGAVALTREWPEIAWETIVSILDKAQVGPIEEKELHAIVDEYVWPIGQKPFTLRYIYADRFKESVSRELSRHGMKPAQSFERNLSLEAAAGQCGIINTARHERERIGIAIAESRLLHMRTTFGGTEASFDEDNKIFAPKGEQHNEVPLMGRKAIADYLEVSESTVKNYMKKYRTFPIFSQGGRKCAMPSKLNAWRTRKKN